MRVRVRVEQADEAPLAALRAAATRCGDAGRRGGERGVGEGDEPGEEMLVHRIRERVARLDGLVRVRVRVRVRP